MCRAVIPESTGTDYNVHQIYQYSIFRTHIYNLKVGLKKTIVLRDWILVALTAYILLKSSGIPSSQSAAIEILIS